MSGPATLQKSRSGAGKPSAGLPPPLPPWFGNGDGGDDPSMFGVPDPALASIGWRLVGAGGIGGAIGFGIAMALPFVSITLRTLWWVGWVRNRG
jgi:hypothetical protein